MINRLNYLAAALFLLIGWQVSALIAGELIIPAPAKVFSLLLAEVQTAIFWMHLKASVLRILAALLISFFSAVPLGLFLGATPALDRLSRPLIYLSYPIPKIVLLPVIFLIFGLGDGGKIAMLSLILFFQLLITSRDAAREISPQMRYSLLSLGGTKRHLYAHVIIPSSLPGVFSALRVATGTVVAVLFFVESIGTRYGMGFYILDAWGRAYTPQIFVGILVLAGLGVLLYESFDLLERSVCRWKRNR
jgi:NitT/TauT family transport system permease protein